MSLIKKRIGLDATCFNQRQSGAKQRFISLYTELFKIMPSSKFIFLRQGIIKLEMI